MSLFHIGQNTVFAIMQVLYQYHGFFAIEYLTFKFKK